MDQMHGFMGATEKNTVLLEGQLVLSFNLLDVSGNKQHIHIYTAYTHK